MQSLDLSSYVQDFAFWDKIKNKNMYDEVIVLWSQKNTSDLGTTLLSFWPGNKDETVFVPTEDAIYSKKTLYILDDFGLGQLDASFWQQPNATVINLSVGLDSVAVKVAPEVHDIEVVWKSGWSICEVYDVDSLMSFLLTSKGSQYLRLNAAPVSDTLFHKQDDLSQNQDLLSLDRRGVGGGQATVLCAAGLLGTILQSVQILQAQEIFVDVFAICNYRFEVTDVLKNSVARSQCVVLVLDHAESDFLESYFRKLFADIDGVKFHFVYPEYQNMSSFLREFRPDEVGMDQVSLVEKIVQAIHG